ncbi:MAG: hypothetical protein JOZ99_13285, partial [Actinobacteria bacterium]|nr:hypothetical protein [Actinomycetota bacterium]
GGGSGGSAGKSLQTLPKAVVPTTAVDMATTTTTEPKQRVTLTPASGITDGQTVQVAAKGFKPNAKSLLVIECADKPDSGAGDCDFGHPPVDADATGNVATTFTVSKGPVGSNKNMCTAAQRCLIVITEAAPNGDNGTAPIVFGS